MPVRRKIAWQGEPTPGRFLIVQPILICEAFRLGLIEDGEIWMKMVESRNLTSQTCDETTSAQIASAVVDTYFAEFELLLEKMEKIEADESE